MEHSISGYLSRRSSEELIRFLETCMQQDSWQDYKQTVPLVFEILDARHDSIPQQLYSAWSEFLSGL